MIVYGGVGVAGCVSLGIPLRDSRGYNSWEKGLPTATVVGELDRDMSNPPRMAASDIHLSLHLRALYFSSSFLFV